MNATIELIKVKAELVLKNNNRMIKENEVLDLLGNEFPQINQSLEKIANPSNVYNAISCFADFTKQLVRNGNFEEVKHCFNVAEKMLVSGNNTVKNAIENGYVFSISTLIDVASPISQKIKGLMTSSLRNEYNRQIRVSGI